MPEGIMRVLFIGRLNRAAMIQIIHRKYRHEPGSFV
ncbi:Protein of unknown function [Pyronema omphalodes CBS 100304]|uniref:Uncharacterized protein n=1 Tax=Pyronema omphalodes (strain CBS 100304) TaxID=1076935 RepID=U4L1Y4_PYROM|nr:Protein of unknown function [Pyronema omphalodes CBS 100304]